MPSHRVTPPSSRPRIIAIIAVAILALTLMGGSLASAARLEPVVTEVVPTEPPPPTPIPPTPVPPTPIPPTPIPPTPIPPTPVPPTPIPPTQIPPTEVPPTEIPPTEVPPTEVPTQTPTPTQTPNPFPSTPSVPPPVNRPAQPPATNGPADAGDITITCTPIGSQATPAVEAGPWDLRLCTVPAPFATVASLDIRALSSDPGWRVILVDPSDAQAPGLLNASNNRAVISHRPGQPDSTFLLGTQRTCSAIGSTILRFDLVGTGGDSRLTATGTLDLATPVASPPTVTLQQVTLSDSIGTITFSYETTASTTCPWQISIALPGANDIQLTELTGPEGVAAVTTPGVVVVTIPTGAEGAEIALTVDFSTSPPSHLALEALVHP